MLYFKYAKLRIQLKKSPKELTVEFLGAFLIIKLS